MGEIWLTIILAGILTYLIRLSFIFLFGRWQPPIRVARALRFVPPAVLSAIIFPAILINDSGLNLTPGNLRLWAALVAALLAWRTKNILLTIAAGMGTLYLLTWLIK